MREKTITEGVPDIEMARKQLSENARLESPNSAGAVPSRRKTTRRANRLPSQADAPAAVESAQTAVAAAVAPDPCEPTHEEIARLAYSYWESRGCQGGCPEEDWTRAEQELRARA